MIIGITGKSGSGKTFYSSQLNIDNMYLVIDVDKLVQELLNDTNIQNSLIEKYGEEIIENNEINKKKLGNIVFSSKESTKEYNDFIWEYIKIELQRQISNSQKDVIIDWSLLPLTDYLEKCNVKILIEQDSEIRKQRILKRDKITEEYFIKRENHSLEYKKEDYDIVINGNDLSNLKNIKEFIERRKNV